MPSDSPAFNEKPKCGPRSNHPNIAAIHGLEETDGVHAWFAALDVNNVL
jgi:hypothetical protein